MLPMQKCKQIGLYFCKHFSPLNYGIFGTQDYLMFSPSHDLLDCRQLCIYIDTINFCHAADKVTAPSLSSHDCAVHTKYLQCTKLK